MSECQTCKGAVGHPIDEVASITDFSKEPQEASIDCLAKGESVEPTCPIISTSDAVESECQLDDATPCKTVETSKKCGGSKLSANFMNALCVQTMTLLGRVGDKLAKYDTAGYLYSHGNGLVEVVPELLVKISKLWNTKLNGVIQCPEDAPFDLVAASDGEVRAVVGCDENLLKRWNATKQCWEYIPESEWIADLIASGVIVNGTNGTNGTNGVDGTNGTNGVDGTSGQSAYDIWLEEGNIGSKAIFLESLKGVCSSNCQSCTD